MAREVERLGTKSMTEGGDIADRADDLEWRKKVQASFDEWYFGDSKVTGRIDTAIQSLI